MSLILVLQIVVDVLLILVVLIQSQSVGLGAAFGGKSMTFRSKKGVERWIMVGTVVLGLLFGALSIVNTLSLL